MYKDIHSLPKPSIHYYVIFLYNLCGSIGNQRKHQVEAIFYDRTGCFEKKLLDHPGLVL